MKLTQITQLIPLAWRRPAPQTQVQTPASFSAPVPVEQKPVSPPVYDDPKKAFARAQRKRLYELGLDADQVQRVFHAAGPGVAVLSVEWIRAVLKYVPNMDALSCLLRGMSESSLSDERIQGVLQSFNIAPPRPRDSRALRAVLLGALEYLRPEPSARF